MHDHWSTNTCPSCYLVSLHYFHHIHIHSQSARQRFRLHFWSKAPKIWMIFYMIIHWFNMEWYEFLFTCLALLYNCLWQIIIMCRYEGWATHGHVLPVYLISITFLVCRQTSVNQGDHLLPLVSIPGGGYTHQQPHHSILHSTSWFLSCLGGSVIIL